MTARTGTPSTTSTQRHAALRARLRERGYKRRTVWLSEAMQMDLERVKDRIGGTNDGAIAAALEFFVDRYRD